MYSREWQKKVKRAKKLIVDALVDLTLDAGNNGNKLESREVYDELQGIQVALNAIVENSFTKERG